MKRLMAFLFSALACPVFGLDLTIADGTVYQEIRLLEKSDAGIRVGHTGGIASLNYLRMRPEDAKTFGYDELKYQALVKRLSAARAEAVPQPVAQPPRTPDPVEPTRPTRPARAYVAPAPVVRETTTAGTARGQCAAYTKKGYRCSRMAASGSSTCWQH